MQGTVYVGFEQHSSDYINLGFDRSYNSSDNIFYYTSGYWQRSILAGSLMMRPYFGQSAVAGIAEAQMSQNAVNLYPNPCKEVLRLDYDETNATLSSSNIEVYDMCGRLLKRQNIEKQINVSDLRSGVYLLRITSAGGQLVGNKKFIVK